MKEFDGYPDYRLTVGDEAIHFVDDPLSRFQPSVTATQIARNNDPEVEQATNLYLSASTTQSFQWSLTEGIRVGQTVSGKFGLPGVCEVGGQGTWEANFSATQTTAHSETKTWTAGASLRVPARSQIRATMVVDDQQFEQPFEATCILRGGFWSASPSPVDGHYYWFHAVSTIFGDEPGFSVASPSAVKWTGRGVLKAQGGARSRVEFTREPYVPVAELQEPYVTAASAPSAAAGEGWSEYPASMDLSTGFPAVAVAQSP